MSSPSRSSSTVYTGVVDGIVRLDFASTDDLIGSNSHWYRDNLSMDINSITGDYRRVSSHRAEEKILELSGYERPSLENKSTSAKLRSQIPFWSMNETDEQRERKTGWDRRWMRVDQNPSWRPGRG
jgi:hypothetical protein